LGENFCHVILESLAAGCPVLISDCTPWRNLASQGAGWDLPLEGPQGFRDVLQRCIDLEQDAYAELRRQARQFAVTYHRDCDGLRQNRRLFEAAYHGGPVSGAAGVRARMAA
jgi:glycosyltransferase involved in cell wall biosynthesis